jgi:hypothetical protein
LIFLTFLFCKSIESSFCKIRRHPHLNISICPKKIPIAFVVCTSSSKDSHNSFKKYLSKEHIMFLTNVDVQNWKLRSFHPISL